MGNRIVHGVNTSTGKNFTGQRQPVRPMPLRLKAFIRFFCDLNGMYLSDDSSYMVYNNIKNGKSELIRLYFDYQKKGNQEFVIARNTKHNVRINVTGAMQIQNALSQIGFDENVTDLFTQSIRLLCDEKS